MWYTKILILIILLFLSMHFPMNRFVELRAEPKTHSIKPKNAKKRIATIISGKTRYYYPLSSENISTVTVKGPGEMRIISRVRFSPAEKNKVMYKIIYKIDGGEEQEIKLSGVERSQKTTYKDGTLGVPGQLKDFKIELGRGYHTLEFRLKEPKPPVAVRYIFTAEKTKKREWISLTPLSPNDPVDLIIREDIGHYYRFSQELPLKVEIIGPTQLRIFTRVENNYDMKGRINYRVQVRENGKVANTYQLNSRRSEIAAYQDNGKLIPGKACEIVINVPKGRQVYEIIPLDKDKGTLLGRLMFPKKDVNLED